VVLDKAAADALIKFGDRQIDKSTVAIEARNYDKINCKDVSAPLFGTIFKNGFGAFWGKMRLKNPKIKDMTHTTFRFMVETKVLKRLYRLFEHQILTN
jgi:hypothetical protein